MNIVIFSWRGPGHPNAGGAEIVTHEHAKAWVKAGHKVTLFTSYYAGAKKREIIDGVQIIRKGNDFIGVKLNAFYWFLHLNKKPDLVIDHFHGIPFFTPLFVRGKKLAFIHEVAKEVWWMNDLNFPFNLLYGGIGYFLEPYIFKFFYKNIPFVTVSSSTKEDLINWAIPRKNIKVIYNGVKKIVINVQKEKQKTAIFLGVLSKDKGIEDALDVFGLLNQKDPSWQFWVVGRPDPRYLKKLKGRCRKLGIRRKIKFWGYVSDRKKFELLARSWVMVNPSVREGWGLVNIEANCVGIPVVAYDVSGNRDSIKNDYSGILCKEKLPKCLARKIIDLVADKKTYKRLSNGAKLWSGRFNWKRATERSEKVIEEIGVPPAYSLK